MGIANIDNFDAGTVTEVNQNNIWDRLNQMLLTFKFADSKPSPNPAASSKTQGILMGHVFIGHNCPVQRAGIPCPPSPEALAATQIIVYKPDGVTVVASTYPKPEAAGSTSQLDTYSFSLLPGNYLVDYKSSAGFFKGHAPQPVTITAGKTTTLDFNIDTGIR